MGMQEDGGAWLRDQPSRLKMDLIKRKQVSGDELLG